MSALRLLSLGFALFIFIYIIWLSRQMNIYVSNRQRIVGLITTIIFLVIGINPDVLNQFLALLSFEQGNGGRIIGLLVLAVFVLYLQSFRMQSEVNDLQHTLNRFVRELAMRQYEDNKDHGDSTDKIMVVIPAYYEAENIGLVLGRMPKFACNIPIETIVIVDGSKDNTEEIVLSYGHDVATHIINRGGGAALHLGYDIALSRKASIIVTMDADGQHQPEEIERLVEPIINKQADMVNGSRVLGVYEKDQMIRAAGVVFFNRLISLLLMQEITDCSNAFRAISVEALAEVRPNLMQRQFHSTELLIEVVRRGFRMIEVPITITNRIAGESKKGPTFKYAFGFTRAIFSTWLR